jgi:hypothetical protein
VMVFQRTIRPQRSSAPKLQSLILNVRFAKIDKIDILKKKGTHDYTVGNLKVSLKKNVSLNTI